MNWLSQNWFWLLMGTLFVFMHLGHGGHGGHGGHAPDQPRDGNDGDSFRKPDEPGRRSGHQH